MVANCVISRERLIKISQYIEQRSEDFKTIKDGVQNAEKRLSELHLTLQSNQKITEARAAQDHSELRSAWEGLEDKLENHFSRVEKEEQRALNSMYPPGKY
jgi:iron uptake system EfeUOB component EfeO/EfeM